MLITVRERCTVFRKSGAMCCYLQTQLEVLLIAGERGTVYCKSGILLLEMPLSRGERGATYSKSKTFSRC
jgi:hypothetical protein